MEWRGEVGTPHVELQKRKDRHSGNATYCLGKDVYSRCISNRSTASAVRCAATEGKVRAKKVSSGEKPKALKMHADKPEAIPKGVIKEVGLYISEQTEFEEKMNQHLPGEKNKGTALQYKQWIERLRVLAVQSETMTSADSNMDKDALKEWCTNASESTEEFSLFRDRIAKALRAVEELHSHGEDEPTAVATPLGDEADAPTVAAVSPPDGVQAI